jgi:hypothetical protein
MANKNSIIMATESELAWAGGFCDGEACITAVWQRYKEKDGKQRPPTTRLKLAISQNCWSTLNRLQRILGETSYINEVPYNIGQNRRVYLLQYDGMHALKAIRKLAPYLYRKKKYVDVAERLVAEGKLGQRPGRNGWPPEVIEAREKWVAKLRRLH